ncbi:PWWP domain [Arabidopsis suecica]|uniref:PWWP domain n=1 Tax=Arabidopsis suecica TaxID=45249 RepID=A0A8T1Z6V6_ARASU|nr:PWWP domain [Arabidopsis suecica]
MSTEPEGVESDSNADFSVNASRFEYGMANTSETLADPMSFQAQDLTVKLTGVERKGFVSARDDKDSLCNKVDSDAESGDFGENRNLDDSGEKDSKFENLDGVVLAGSYLLKSKDKNGFADENLKLFDSDLVWAKIRSYPWWPGQVFDASAASKAAKKHFKKGNLLVVYFGDCTFAWNNASQIKPFHQNFSQMQEQSNLAKFRDAVDCALDEVSRRVEFGLSCSCVSEEAYNKLKTQNIINAGIHEDSRVRYGGDKLSNAISFEPAKLVDYMKHLACFPSYDVSEKLQFVINRAQVLAFQQWKDYSPFIDYETFLRSVESAATLASLPEANMDEGISFKKRKADYKDNAEQTKEKTLSDLIVKKRCGSRSTEKLDGKSHSEKKRKVESSESGKSEKKIKNNQQKEDSVSKESNEESNLSVCDANKLQKVAEPCHGIRVENEMNSLTPTLKPCSDSKSTEVENEKTKKPRHEELAERKISSPDEMLSSLHAATPTGVPDSISIDPLNYIDFEQFINELSCSKLNDDSKKASITETSEPCVQKDSAEEILPANKEITGSRSKEETGLKDCSADSSPYALVLNFSDSGSVPSEEKLNEIFNRYGPLHVSKTKVTKKGKRAKVVFKRGEDAKTAFSSAGKYSIFGPSLLSYRLEYVCPKAKKSNNMTD